MTTRRYDIVINQGASFRVQPVLRDAAGTLIDLSGADARMQIRRSVAYGGSSLASLTVGSGITLGGAAGTITIDLTPAQTSALPPGAHVYDLELVDSAGSVFRILEGAATVRREVTV